MPNIKKPITWDVDENGCFNCTSHHIAKDGYVKIRKYKRTLRLHRYIYEEMYGFIPNGLVVRHKCDNRRCINPEHLELGTYKDNNHDQVKRGRHGRTKLTQEQVDKMRNDWEQGNYNHYYEVAEKYSISPATAWRTINKVNWNIKKEC
jgi:hypothetical protein